MDNREIIELATLYLAVDQSPEDDILAERFSVALEHAFDTDSAGAMQTWLAIKLLSGRPFELTSDNPETIRRARSIAADLGAMIEEFEQDGGSTRVVFKPANQN